MATFQVSETTTKVLKNFAGISNMLMLRSGKTQKTVAQNKAVLAVAELPEAWPMDTGIYDLNKFLGTLSLFKSPRLQFKDEHMLIAADASKVRYRYSDPSLLPEVPDKVLRTDNPGVTFRLGDALSQLNKTCALLGLSSVTVTIAAGTVTLRAQDAKMPDSHAFEYTVGEKDATFYDDAFERTVVFKQEYLALLMDGAYDVSIGPWKYGYFQHTKEPVSYFIAGQS